MRAVVSALLDLRRGETQGCSSLLLSGLVLLMIHLVTRGTNRVSWLIRCAAEIHPRERGYDNRRAGLENEESDCSGD